MSQHPHLFCRNGWYYLRMRIPHDLHAVLSRREFCKSLKTKDLLLAQNLKEIKASTLERIFALIRTGMLNTAQIQQILYQEGMAFLANTEASRDRGDMAYAGDNYLPQMEQAYAAAQKDLKDITFDSHRKEVLEIIRRHDLPLQEGTEEFRSFYRKTLKMRLAAYKIEMERCRGNYDNPYDNSLQRTLGSPPPPPPEPASPPARTSAPVPTRTLSMVMELFMEARSKKSNSTLNNYRGMNALLLKVLGDKAIDAYTYEDCLNARKILERMPKNATSYPDWQDRSLKSLLHPESPSKPYAANTVMKYLIHLNTLFNFCVERKWLSQSVCPTWELSREEKKQAKRYPYDKDDLKKLFTSPHYTLRNRRYERPQNFWLPLLGLFTGLRIDEGCQLYKTDIVKIQGIWCLDINDDLDKKIKRESSIRTIPIHPILIKLGFLDFVKSVDHPWLFPQLKNDPERGWGYSHDFDKNINKYLKRHVDATERKTFHSTRRSFAAGLKQQGVHNDIIGALLGHHPSQEITESYTGKYSPAVCLDALKKLDFDIDIPTLIGRWDPNSSDVSKRWVRPCKTIRHHRPSQDQQRKGKSLPDKKSRANLGRH